MCATVTDANLLLDGPAGAAVTVALAHGAGAPMDSPYMAAFAEGLAAAGLRVARFEFDYMAARRRDGRRRGPESAAALMVQWRAVIDHLGAERLVIGGKSMGGRIASMVADDAGVRRLVCLGYPFHPPGKPEKTRTQHLAALRTPTLILQGTRDPFGTKEDVAGYTLSPAIRFHWLDDGDHDMKPRKASGLTQADHWNAAIAAIAAFADEP